MIRIEDKNRNNQNYFSQYDAVKQIPMTYPTALWRNNIQEEICGWIESQNQKLDQSTNQFATTMDDYFRTAIVFYEDDIQKDAELPFSIENGQSISFSISIELNTKIIGYNQFDPDKIKGILNLLSDTSFFEKPSAEISEDFQKLSSATFSLFHRPIFRVHLSHAENKSVTFEHGQLMSDSISAATKQFKKNQYFIQKYYNESFISEQLQFYFPVLFQIDQKNKISIKYNRKSFGNYIQGIVRVFDLKIVSN